MGLLYLSDSACVMVASAYQSPRIGLNVRACAEYLLLPFQPLARTFPACYLYLHSSCWSLCFCRYTYRRGFWYRLHTARYAPYAQSYPETTAQLYLCRTCHSHTTLFRTLKHCFAHNSLCLWGNSSHTTNRLPAYTPQRVPLDPFAL